ncbi:MAG: sulfite oxidase [Pirellulales bacterium]
MAEIQPRREGVGRREFVAGVAVAALPLAGTLLSNPAGAQNREAQHKNATSAPGVIVRQNDPDNLEYPFANLDSFLTPNEQFYVRNHFPVPEVDAKAWRLRVEGAVEHPFEIGYDELRKISARTVTALLECSGNGRIRLKAPQVGIRWDQGGVGNAEWTGVPLSELLKRAGVKNGAVEVILEGADKGKFDAPLAKSPGEISFARSLTLSKAKQPEVLLAFEMNGAELTPDHGHPVRVIVPGWYGMASVKWLKRIVVAERPFQGYFQTFAYTVWERRDGLSHLTQVADLQVKSQIARPTRDEILPAGSQFRIYGAAWTGEGQVAKVEVSTDGGKQWTAAQLQGKPVRYAWRLWAHQWSTPAKPGRYTVMARATDDQGRVQPMERDEDRRDAMITHVEPIRVEVR